MSATATARSQSVKIHSTAIVADKALLTGTYDIEIGENTVIHPYAKLTANGGKITIGAYCTVAEGSTIGHTNGEQCEILLEDYVQVDSSAVVMASTVGKYSRLGIQSIVGAGSVIGKCCTVPPKIVLAAGAKLDDFTALLDGDQIRQDKNEASRNTLIGSRKQQIEAENAVLRKLIPNAAAKYTVSRES